MKLKRHKDQRTNAPWAFRYKELISRLSGRLWYFLSFKEHRSDQITTNEIPITQSSRKKVISKVDAITNDYCPSGKYYYSDQSLYSSRQSQTTNIRKTLRLPSNLGWTCTEKIETNYWNEGSCRNSYRNREKWKAFFILFGPFRKEL